MDVRAYSVIEFKAVDQEQRILEGIATTPATDRVGDIVEPEGAEFKLPLPFLWQHNSDEPVGHVIAAKVTPKGITIRAKIEKTDEPGRLKDRLDEAWQTLKLGLVRGLSIGFKAIESMRIEDTWSYRFTKWEWLELSAVTIPANMEANIQNLKSYDVGLAATGNKSDIAQPGATGKPHSIKLGAKEATTMKTVGEQIAALEATRGSKAAAMEAVLAKSIEEGRSTDAAEQEQFDTLSGEVDAIDADLKRLRTLERISASKAKTIDVRTEDDGGKARELSAPSVIKMHKQLAPGIRFARLARCVALGRMGNRDPMLIAEHLYKDDDAVHAVLKAAVAAGSTIAGNWAAALVGAESDVFADFAEFLRPQTIVGKFGNGGIPSLRRVPFRVALMGQTSGGQGYWVGEGKAKPLTKFDFARTTLTPLKVANIAVVTMELLRDSSPSAETLLRDGLAAALKERLDIDFIDPAKAAVAGVSPASITNGITPIPSTGNTPDAIREDIRLVMSAFAEANNPPLSGVWIMSSTTALALGLLRNPLSQEEFPGVTMNGGTFAGLPVITSEYVDDDTVILANASDIYFADEGEVGVDMSTEASLEMDDAPAHNSTTPTPAAGLVSLWQTNSVGFRAERTVNWKRRRDEGVQVLSGVAWGQPVTP